MYRGFKIPEFDFNNKAEYYRIGLGIFKDFEKKSQNSLKKYISVDGVLDGEKMKEDWFPTIEAHVFISHSHNDRDFAITLAGFLYEKFRIVSFIDSCIWGYANNLLLLIDKKYCWQEASNTYNYTKRNLSTSHVHMMLSTALTKMIDKTECLLFLNTPNSIIASEIEDKTLSPWIYSEIETSRMIRINLPNRPTRKMFSGGVLENQNENLSIKYPINSGHLSDIIPKDLDKLTRTSNPLDALDKLYKLYQIKKILK